MDVLASVARGSSDRPRTYAIIRGALVLALNSAIEPIADQSPAPGAGGNVPTTVTLGVTVQQASLLTVAETADVMDFQDATPAPRNVPPPANPATAPVAVAQAPKRHVVPIVDGDKLVQGDQ